METLTKKEIIDEVTIQAGMERKAAEEAVETFIELIKEQLEKGEDVTLSGFGKWAVRNKNERRGRNPQTGDELVIAPRRVVTFSLSNVLRKMLDSGK